MDLLANGNAIAGGGAARGRDIKLGQQKKDVFIIARLRAKCKEVTRIMKKLEEQIAGADDSGVKAVGILLREICRMSPQAAAGWNM